MKTLKLGSRRSLLAWAQSSQVARAIEALDPMGGLRVELVGIDTRGDRIVDVSLRMVAGKEFFVAELDDALRSGAVDLSVHSLKDLSLERPAEFTCAAVPIRRNPRDVLLVGPGALESLRQGRRLKIGTSSPRRLENVPRFLEKALPFFSGKAPRVELLEIRGNVNTRLSRIHETGDRYLDGVILAFAGLARLWDDEPGRAELSRLLMGARWMVLPLKECPAAPGQGALAVECRAADRGVVELLSRLHDRETAAQVARERAVLAEWGGGCHQKFGATAIRSREAGEVLYVRGRLPDDQPIDLIEQELPPVPAHATAWDGSLHRAEYRPMDESVGQLQGAVFIAHARALPEPASGRPTEVAQDARVWTSGASSWFRLARRGIWVEGCAEGLGFEQLRPTLTEPVLGLPELSRWSVLTHSGAIDDWKGKVERVIPTYEVLAPRAGVEGALDLQGLARASHVFWSSGSQFDALKSHVAPGVHHACGPGKTAFHLRQNGVEPDVFVNSEVWRKWLQTG